MTETAGIRIQKVLAQAGLGSRRVCDALVEAGRVTVNGQVAESGCRVVPGVDVIAVDGTTVELAPDRVVIALNKPWGVVTTMSDDQGRPCVGDMFADYPLRLFHVGRLDEETEGLLLLTNDGDLAHRLLHPAQGVRKTYVARVRGRVKPAALRALLAGVDLEDGPATADEVVSIASFEHESVIELTLHEGRKRIVRRMCKAVGHPVVHLTRIAVGSLELGTLKPGEWRELSPLEVGRLYDESKQQ